jgi:hypothetical protein
MAVLIFSLATLVNIIVLRFKWNRNHKIDCICDFTILMVLLYIFGGSFEGTIIAMITGALMSTYLWFYPPRIKFKNPFRR